MQAAAKAEAESAKREMYLINMVSLRKTGN